MESSERIWPKDTPPESVWDTPPVPDPATSLSGTGDTRAGTPDPALTKRSGGESGTLETDRTKLGIPDHLD